VRGRLVPQRVIDAGLESQRLLAQRMTERELIDTTCALLRSAFECDVQFDGAAFQFGARGRAFSAGELRIVEGVCGQLVAAIEAEGRRRREYEMRELAARAELSALRAQIQPHFLFNVLNTLAELVRQNPSAAESMIEHLADIFRYALASTRRDLVPLGEEVDFVRAYLAIEQARFEYRLGIELDVPEECRDVRIPPMTLQPLVENAIRHGVGRSVSGGTVSIVAEEHERGVRIVVVARSDDRSLAASDGEGIALENVRARLEGLAGARLDLTTIAHGTAVTIEVPL
jgi:LytS/YehU family sensor histidine kinase